METLKLDFSPQINAIDFNPASRQWTFFFPSSIQLDDFHSIKSMLQAPDQIRDVFKIQDFIGLFNSQDEPLNEFLKFLRQLPNVVVYCIFQLTLSAARDKFLYQGYFELWDQRHALRWSKMNLLAEQKNIINVHFEPQYFHDRDTKRAACSDETKRIWGPVELGYWNND